MLNPLGGVRLGSEAREGKCGERNPAKSRFPAIRINTLLTTPLRGWHGRILSPPVTSDAISEPLSSPALSIVGFSDIDAFRPVSFVADARSVPLNLTNFNTARAMVQLPFCQITVLNSFPRIVDVSYRAADGLVIFQLEDNYEVSVNGMSAERPAFIGMRGNVDLQFVEPRSSLHAIIRLDTGLKDREWFETPDALCPFLPDAGALAAVRSVTAEILQTASARPDLLQEMGSALALQEQCCSPSTRCSAAAARRK